MTDPKLLPLPERAVVDTHIPTGVRIYGWTEEQVQSYSRANMEPLIAENEALGMEIEGHRIAIQQLYDRSERLAEALKRARESIEEWAYFANSCGGEIVGLQEELSEIDLILRDHSKEAS